MSPAKDTGAATDEDGDGVQKAFPWRPDSAQRRARRARAEVLKTVTEIDLHQAVARFLDWCLSPPATYSTFPSGWDKMSKSRAGKLYACGLMAGCPDIFLFWDGHTFGIELKTPKGRLSPAQKRAHEKLADAGVIVLICRSVDDVEQCLRELKIPLRGTCRAKGSI